jgi:nitrous oxide reductase accessory protein NosL
MSEPNDERRRKVLKTLGVSAVAGVGATTGCIGGNGDDGGEGNETDDGTNETDGDMNETDTGDGEETAEPVDFPEDAECPVCNMMSAEYPDWNAQVVHEDGERAYLCTSGCMVAYKAYPDEFAVSDTSIAGAWVTGYETRELIDGTEASYALETDSERVDDPMMLNPAPFEAREDAVAYVEEVDYLAEEDIVGYGDLDTDWADMYRGRYTPDGEETEAVEPMEFPDDAECPVCNMMSAEFPDWNAQVVHEDGERAYLCTSGCMTAYKAYPEEFSVSDSSGAGSDIAGVWVTGYETRELIDGKEAEYALENDPERVDDPMMVNPAPFESSEDAVAYVEEVDHLAEEDIVGYDDLDPETADMYRGQLTPGGGEA